MLFVLHLNIAYKAGSLCNVVQCYFPRLLNFIKSDDKKNENVVIKQPKQKYGFTFVIIHQIHKSFYN